MIRILKRGTRVRLRNLLGKTIDGSIVTDASGWWPFAKQRTKQTLVTAPSSTITTSTISCATREQHFRQDYDSPTRLNLHPFGESCFVVLQKSARFNSVTDTAERAIYMFNGQYNPFSHLFADAPQAHVLLCSCNRLQITGRVVFPYTKPSSDGTADPTRAIPGDTPSPFPEEAQHGGESKPPEVPHPSSDQNRYVPISSVWSQSRVTSAEPLESTTSTTPPEYDAHSDQPHTNRLPHYPSGAHPQGQIASESSVVDASVLGRAATPAPQAPAPQSAVPATVPLLPTQPNPPTQSIIQ